jgi:hypothetical protein
MTTPGKLSCCIAFELEGCRVFVRLVLGRRGGLSEDVIAIDPRQPIVADRLLTATRASDELFQGVLVDLSTIRNAIHHGGDCMELCMGALVRLLEEARNDPSMFFESIRQREESAEGHSVRRVLPGGIPGSRR